MRFRCPLLPAVLLTVCLTASTFAETIHEACVDGDIEQVRSLLAEHPDWVNQANDRGSCPLHIAAHEANVELIRFLIEVGANLEAKDGRGNTPLLTAIGANSLEAVGLLIEAGADQAAEARIFGKPTDFAFYTESRFGRSGITEYLISLGQAFDPDHIDFTGDARVFIASWFGHSDMLELLLKYNPNLQVIREQNGATPVVDAIIRGNARSAQLLIEHGADISHPDRQNLPPIWHAVDMGMIETLDLLLEHGAEVKMRHPGTGQTLLHLAALRGYSEIVDRLLEHGCGVEARDDMGKTALFFACKYGNKSAAELLLASGADHAECEEDNCGPSPWLGDHPPRPGEAVAWILERRGWAIKTANHLLIIDDENRSTPRPAEPSLANGYYTASEIAGQNVVALYTTYHGMPGEDQYIHSLADSLKSIRYLHSDLDRWRGDSSVVYMKPGDVESLDGVIVRAFDPLESPAFPLLSYLIEVDNLTILFCGFSVDTAQAFRTALDGLMEGMNGVDLAIMAIPSPETLDSSDLKYVVDRVHPKAILLHTPDREFLNYQKAADDILGWNRGTAVFAPRNAGDSYYYTRK